MRISTPVLAGLFGICLAHPAIAQSADIVAGKLDPQATDKQGGFYSHTSDSFDADATRLRAEQASENGDYSTAFGHYLAICAGRDEGDAESCYLAAEIARNNELAHVPPELQSHLYKRACASGHQAACSPTSHEH